MRPRPPLYFSSDLVFLVLPVVLSLTHESAVHSANLLLKRRAQQVLDACLRACRGASHVGTAPYKLHESISQTTYGMGQPLEWQVNRGKFTNTVPKSVSSAAL